MNLVPDTGALSDMSEQVDRLAKSHMRNLLARQDAQIERVLNDALCSGAMRDDFTIVLVFDRSKGFNHMEARLA